ncbi:MAG: hypothetical protein KAH48_00360 [Chlorobi bacterium]|nr:hypothetical protein [Chlorobiota bacterium]
MSDRIEEENFEESQNAPQEDQNLVIRTQNYMAKNGKKLLVTVVVSVLLIVVLSMVWSNFQASADQDMEDAAVATDRVMKYYAAGEYEKALNGDDTKTIRGEKIIGLTEIADNYASSIQGKTAALYAGNAYLALNQADKAAEYFDVALNCEPKLILIGANAGLGACREMTGNNKDAAEYFEKAAELSSTENTKNRYKYYAALNLEKSGDNAGAETIYRLIVDMTSGYSEFANYAKEGLARLGTIIE